MSVIVQLISKMLNTGIHHKKYKALFAHHPLTLSLKC